MTNIISLACKEGSPKIVQSEFVCFQGGKLNPAYISKKVDINFENHANAEYKNPVKLGKETLYLTEKGLAELHKTAFLLSGLKEEDRGTFIIFKNGYPTFLGANDTLIGEINKSVSGKNLQPNVNIVYEK